MTDKIVDFRSHRETKANEIRALRARLDARLDCDTILADAIEQMWDFAERAEIVETLRRAANKLESPKD